MEKESGPATCSFPRNTYRLMHSCRCCFPGSNRPLEHFPLSQFYLCFGFLSRLERVTKGKPQPFLGVEAQQKPFLLKCAAQASQPQGPGGAGSALRGRRGGVRGPPKARTTLHRSLVPFKGGFEASKLNWPTFWWFGQLFGICFWWLGRLFGGFRRVFLGVKF